MSKTASHRVDAATVTEWLSDNRDVKILDVRSPAEFEAVHIPGSYNVPLATLGEHANEVARDLSEEVVVVCQSGARAQQAEARLTASGLSGVHLLDGGIAAYQSAGGKVVRGRDRWDLERQVRLAAGSLVLAGTVGSLKFRPLLGLAGGIGAGLSFAAATNTCAMGKLLLKLPYNRAQSAPDGRQLIDELISGRE